MNEHLKQPDIPQLYRLAEAVQLFFPSGGITVKSLRNEAQHGRLQCIRLAGKLFVTREAIMAMLERCKCSVKDSPPSENAQAAHHNRLSLAEREKRAQAALQAMLPPGARRVKDI